MSAILRVQVSTEALLVAPITTEEGEHIPLHPVPIDFGISGDSTEVPFLWPVTLLHHISEDSPFWKVTRPDATLLSIIIRHCSSGMLSSGRAQTGRFSSGSLAPRPLEMSRRAPPSSRHPAIKVSG